MCVGGGSFLLPTLFPVKIFFLLPCATSDLQGQSTNQHIESPSSLHRVTDGITLSPKRQILSTYLLIWTIFSGEQSSVFSPVAVSNVEECCWNSRYSARSPHRHPRRSTFRKTQHHHHNQKCCEDQTASHIYGWVSRCKFQSVPCQREDKHSTEAFIGSMELGGVCPCILLSEIQSPWLASAHPFHWWYVPLIGWFRPFQIWEYMPFYLVCTLFFIRINPFISSLTLVL